jgi:hypothetical protein
MMNRLLLFSFIPFMIFLTSGCGGSGSGSVALEGGGGQSLGRVFIGHASLQGATSQIPYSSNYVLGIHHTGGNFTRTSSSSASFKMVSGVGVD